MSNTFDNPYEAKARDGMVEWTLGKRATETMPTWLTVFAVLFIIFGALGVLAFPQAIVGLVLQSSFSPPSAGPGAEFNRKAMELGKQMMIPGIIFAFLESLLSSFCILGGIQILRRKKVGLAIASTTCFWALFFEVGRSIFTLYAVYLQQDMFAAFPIGQIKDPAAEGFVKAIMENMIYVIGCFSFGIIAFRFAYYGFAWSISDVRRISNSCELIDGSIHAKFAQPKNRCLHGLLRPGDAGASSHHPKVGQTLR